MRYFDKQGQPISMLEWARRTEDMSYKRIALTYLPDGGDVSTVWLGLDHSFGGGPPLIFESMLFREGEDNDCERYSTEAEARAGHEEMVRRWSPAH